MQQFAWILMVCPKLAQMTYETSCPDVVLHGKYHYKKVLTSFTMDNWKVTVSSAEMIPMHVQQVANSSHDIPKFSKGICTKSNMGKKMLDDIANFQLIFPLQSFCLYLVH